MTRRYPEDRISLFEIKKHPWVNSFSEHSEHFQKVMSEKVEIVSKQLRTEALKVVDKNSHHKDFNVKHEHLAVPEHLKKLMLEFKQKTKKTRKECLNLAHTSSKSSSQDDSGVCESEEKPRKLKPGCMKQIQSKPFNPKRSDEDSWSSFSENEDHQQY
jgi:hypothetical protein